MNQIISKHIRVRGIVQGVGFRPFIYKIAQRFSIKGSVLNDTEGVFIKAEAIGGDVNLFIEAITTEKPSLAYISAIEVSQGEIENHPDFIIGPSTVTERRTAFYSPDVCLCQDCQGEMNDSSDRRHNYPFITCINCGPRFSIITNIPYDRPNTTMNNFPLCENCKREYEDPLDRRHHTQPTACPVCGPHMSLHSMNGDLVTEDITEVTDQALKRIFKGEVAAIKGIGGFHLVCDAKNRSAVSLLRERKHRPFKPFALMCSSIEKIRELCDVNEKEEELLLSKERPIVLLKRSNDRGSIAQEVAPSVTSLGIMLPYAPFHFMLFEKNPDAVFIMTSGNISDEPIVYEDNGVYNRLGAIADFIVTYNREISGQSDDSVLFVENNESLFIRRSRGYVPIPLKIETIEKNIFALGGDLKNTFALGRDNHVIVSQYLGDMGDSYTFETYKRTAEHFNKIFNIEPEVIVSDMHPGYHTTQYAQSLVNDDLQYIEVQHHHAHIASVLHDNEYDEKVIGIAFDGTGYGADGTLWGSEFLIADKSSFERRGHFSYFPLPGGEQALKDVWKIGLSLLYKTYGEDVPQFMDEKATPMLLQIMEKGLNSPMTCSIGRLFDGISAILGLSYSVSTEAEAAILLEEAAQGGSYLEIDNLIYKEEDRFIVSVETIVSTVMKYIKEEKAICDIAYSFHQWITEAALALTLELRDIYSLNTVALSGGVFHNRLLLNLMSTSLKKNSFTVLLPKNVPFNDGSISLGQVVVAASKMR